MIPTDDMLVEPDIVRAEGQRKLTQSRAQPGAMMLT